MIWLLALQLAIGPSQHYEEARRDFAERKYSKAIQEVDLALDASPYSVPALVLKARLAMLARRPDVAKSCLITAIESDPSSEDAQLYLGVVFYTENNFILAVSPLESAKVLAPKSALPVFYLAMTQQAMGKTSEALELYQQAEMLSGGKSELDAEILVTHGRFLLSLGRTKESIHIDRLAVAIAPKSRDAHYELAKGLDHEGEFKDAALEGEQALTLPESRTRDAQIHFLLATLYRKLNEPALAKEHLEKFLASRKANGR